MVRQPDSSRPNGRPKSNQCVGMLPGPPGTRKTSLVKALSEMLQWPLVSVPASVMFDKGFDMLETRATEVFHHLNYLTGCVILFDEFEEFFRQRPKSNEKDPKVQSLHDRTIAAFTTSAMLPRLQDLHDEGRCLIFLATNHPEQIDQAILRLGRFDFFLEIEHPDCLRIDKYLAKTTKRTVEMLGLKTDESKNSVHEDDESHFMELVKPVVEAIKPFKDEEEVRFSWIEEALKAVVGEDDEENRKKIAEEKIKDAKKTADNEKSSEDFKKYEKYKGPLPPLVDKKKLYRQQTQKPN